MPFDLQVFNTQTYLALTESVDQNIDLFNKSSSGVITLQNKPSSGDFDIKASFKAIDGLVRRRNVYGTGAVAPQKLEQLKNVSVKVAAGTPPIAWTPAHFAWVQANPSLAALTIGEQLGKTRVKDMINAVIGSLAAAIQNSGNKAVFGSATTDSNLMALNKGAALFGDRSGSLAAWVMHSGMSHTLIDNALKNAERLFSFEGVNILRDFAGRLLIVTDSPALIDTAGATPVYKTLGLQQGAGLVSGNDDFFSNVSQLNEAENIKTTYQAEWTYNVGILGYTWDTVAGGACPNDTALFTPTNWDKTATSIKDTAGVLVISK